MTNKKEKRERDRLRIALQRDGMTNEQREAEREADRGRKRTPAAQAADRERKRIARRNEPSPDRAERQARDRQSKRTKNIKTYVDFKDAMRSSEILDGTYHVPMLQDTDDDIGQMDIKCQHCGAFKFRGESPGSCCQGGKLVVDPFPRPPRQLQDLWFGDGDDAKLFRQNARYINNAVCLSSIKSSERRGGWQPSVVFQGRVEHRAGPLLPSDGEEPKFAQLYVYDAALETDTRFGRMHLPSSVTHNERLKLRGMLGMVQDVLHQHNPFVQDFKQVMEIPEEELVNGKIVISAKAPSGEHLRRYNMQLNLKEVRILTNSQPHDLVLQKKGGGLQSIDDMNPKGMPLFYFHLEHMVGTLKKDM